MSKNTVERHRQPGIEWLGEIPDHWQVRHLKYTFLTLNGSTPKSDEQDYWDGDIPWATPDDLGSLNHNTLNVTRRMITREGYESCGTSLAPAGSLVISTRAPIGHLALAGTALCTNQGCRSLVFRVEAENKYYYYQILTAKQELESWGQGATFKELSRDKLTAIFLVTPPLIEQRSIATFLDRETSRVDELIAKKQRQIELLQEKRLALIHDAVHDSSTQNMRLRRVVDQIFRPIARRNDDIYTPIGLYNRGRGIFHKEPTTGADLGDSDFFWIEKDDLILSGQFAWEGAVALTSEREAGCVASHRYPILRGKPNLMETAYLFAFFTSRTGDFLLNENSRGAAGRNRPLNVGTLLKESIPVPPVEIQARVSAHVYFERRIEQIIARSVSLLEEYRTAVISAAVAGKIDVREEVA
ncbi:MAG: restriction endonuclease subunit S [Syntrophorhabdaceae bacterium]|nr:restriction endonuclease subunit S [Syntrophorhabdaceae bacterium]